MGLDTIPTRSDERGKAIAGRGVLEDLSKDQARHAALTCQLLARLSLLWECLFCCSWYWLKLTRCANANLQLPLAEPSTGRFLQLGADACSLSIMCLW